MTEDSFEQLEEKEYSQVTDKNDCDNCAICQEKFE